MPRLLRTAVRSPSGQGAWFVDAAADVPVTLEWFDPRHWIAREAVIARHTGRGAVIGVVHEGGRYLLRHYLRGGLPALASADRYLWLGEERTRPLAEMRLTLQLHAAGMPVPRPVAVRYERCGATYCGDIITEYLPGTHTLAQRLDEGDLPLATWAAIGRTIRHFHDQGVDHADLNAHNVLLRGEEEVFLVDFDRARLRERTGLWCDANLARLRRSLDALEDGRRARRFDDTQWQVLLAAWWRH